MKFDLERMLREVKEDLAYQKEYTSKKVVSQEEIRELIRKRRGGGEKGKNP